MEGMLEKGKKEKHAEQVQFAVFLQGLFQEVPQMLFNVAIEPKPAFLVFSESDSMVSALNGLMEPPLVFFFFR